MTRVVIALGSNLGDRAANLRRSVEEVEGAGVTISGRSSIWETAPVPADQPRFLNAVIVGEAALEAEELLAVLKRIERDLGRRPGRRWGPREIDLDTLFFGDCRYESGALVIPHPRIAERGFVLAPLAEVLDGPLPGLGRSAEDLLAEVGSVGIVRTDLRLR